MSLARHLLQASCVSHRRLLVAIRTGARRRGGRAHRLTRHEPHVFAAQHAVKRAQHAAELRRRLEDMLAGEAAQEADPGFLRRRDAAVG